MKPRQRWLDVLFGRTLFGHVWRALLVVLAVVPVVLTLVIPDVWGLLWTHLRAVDPTVWTVLGIVAPFLLPFIATQWWQFRTMVRNSLQIRLQNRIEYQKLLFEIDKLLISNPGLKALYTDHQYLLPTEEPERRKLLIQIDGYASFHVNLFEVVYVFFHNNQDLLTTEEREVYVAWLNWLDVMLSTSDHFCRVLNRGVREESYNQWFVDYLRTRPGYDVILAKLLFPQLSTARWVPLNLDARARIDHPGPSRRREDNPLNDPAICSAWVDRVHAQLGAEYSYGGYLEDRSHLWRGHYQEEGHGFIHLGIDFNVPAGTEVIAPHPLIVRESWADPDQDGGWGGRVVARDAETGLYIIFGHLDPASLPVVGEQLTTGARIGLIGRADVNGGWYPHLHVQCVRELPPTGAVKVDGYAKPPVATLVDQYPNPAAKL